MSRLRYLWPTDTWNRLALVPVLAFLALVMDRQYLLDFWHHLARGREMAHRGQLVNTDLYTYTVGGSTLQDANWLSQLIYFWLYSAGGFSLVQVVNAALVGLTFGLIVVLCWQRSHSLLVAMFVGIFTFLGCWQVLTIRPQSFSLLLFVLAYAALIWGEHRPGWYFAPPVLVGLWANLHGAFPAGLLLVGCFFLGALVESWPKKSFWGDRKAHLLGLCLLACCLATLANPYGLSIYEYVRQTSMRASGRAIIEWQPPNWDLVIGKLFFLSLVAVPSILYLSWRKSGRLVRPTEWGLLGLFLVLALSSARMIVWWFLVLAPILTDQLMAFFSKTKENAIENRKTGYAPAIVFLGMVLVVLGSFPGTESYSPLYRWTGRTAHRQEQDLAQAFKALGGTSNTGRIFSRFEWAEYLDWLAGPTNRLFMDARIEIIPNDVWQEYVDVTSGKSNWQAILDRYEVEWILLDRDYHQENGLLEKVKKSPAWQPVPFSQEDIVLFARSQSNGQANPLGSKGGKRGPRNLSP